MLITTKYLIVKEMSKKIIKTDDEFLRRQDAISASWKSYVLSQALNRPDAICNLGEKHISGNFCTELKVTGKWKPVWSIKYLALPDYSMKPGTKASFKVELEISKN